MGRRVKYIDIAKGISIILVALFHSELRDLFPAMIDATNLFTLPLFFFLSGIFFSYRAQPQSYSWKKAEVLLKPYFCVLFIVAVVTSLLGEHAFLWRLKGIFYGVGETLFVDWIPLWFLPHLFILFAFSYLIFRYVKFERIHILIRYLILLVMLMIGTNFIDYFWHRELHLFSRTLTLPGLPFSLDLILVSAFYFMLGITIKYRVIQFRPKLLLLLLAALSLISVFLFTQAKIDLNMRVYDRPVYATIAALSGIYLILTSAFYINKSQLLSTPLRSVGEASLYILIFHRLIQSKLLIFYSTYPLNELGTVLLDFTAFLLSITLPLLIKRIVVKSDILSLAFLPSRSNHLLQVKAG